MFVILLVTVLEQLETDKVYIIGGLVDETPNKVNGVYYFINTLQNIYIELCKVTQCFTIRKKQQQKQKNGKNWTSRSSVYKSQIA